MSTPPPIPIPPRLPTPPPLPPPLPPSNRRARSLSPGRRWARRLVWLTLGIILVVRWFHPPEPGYTWHQLVNPEPPRREDRRFSRPPTQVRAAQQPVPADLWRLEIQLAPEAVNTLRNRPLSRPSGGGSKRAERPEVLATIREGNQTYTNVALHLKGSAGSARQFDDKPAMTLNFSKHAKGQSFHGFSKISLNNSVQDPTYISEALCRELFTAAGVPAPAATHATAVVNGRDLGLFVVVEGWGKPFLRKHFSDVGGNLYEGPFASEVNPEMEVNSGDQPDDHSDIDRLLAVVENRDRTDLWKRLGEVVDVDRYASLLALEVMTCHWDSYSLNRNNYRVFHDRSSERLIFLPHGMDQMFGWMDRMPTSSSIQPSVRGAVARAFMSTREGRQLYRNRVAALSTNLFVEEKLIGRVRELAGHLQPTLAAYGSDIAAQHAAEADHLCRRISERCHSIAEQLISHTEPTPFDPSGPAPLSGWKPRNTQPAARYDRFQQGGQSRLRITANGGTSASWRTQVALNPGEYLFEGIAEIGDAGAPEGVRLRISGTQTEWIPAPAGARIPLQFHFNVEDLLTTVELICELGGPVGQATFDETSLKLIRQ